MQKARKRGNGSIFQQPGCSTQTIQYYAYNGKRVRESTGTDDYRVAQQMLRERLVAIDKGDPFEPRRKRQIMISELYDGLLRHYRVNGRKSLDAVERRWLRLKPFFGDMPARNVTHKLLGDYIDGRFKDNAAPATINRELAALKTMLRLGSKDHKLTVPLFRTWWKTMCGRISSSSPTSTAYSGSQPNYGCACFWRWLSSMAGVSRNF